MTLDHDAYNIESIHGARAVANLKLPFIGLEVPAVHDGLSSSWQQFHLEVKEGTALVLQ